MAYQPAASFGVGAPPPPLRTEPSSRPETPWGSTEPFSSCVIWPIFSSIVICASRADARAAGDRLVSRQSATVAADDAAIVGAGDVGVVVVGDGAHPATRAMARRIAPGRPRRGTDQLPCAMLQIVQYCVRRRRGCSRTVRIANAMSSGLRYVLSAGMSSVRPVPMANSVEVPAGPMVVIR